ncbi:MAG TPA: hypothetical protein VFX98_00080 [Longimicrobiaceae bacterium]|nr:hypothetical protein [Longimicrobiaceae bacterium]
MPVPIPHTRLVVAALAALSLFAAPAARAQQATPPELAAADSAREACIQAADADQRAQADAAADRAEALYGRLQRQLPDDPRPLVGLGQVKTRCRIAFVPMMAKGALLEESNALYERALEIDPRSWDARFSLAMNHFHTPEFMGRTPDALRELQALVAQQGGSAERPSYALPYLYLGDLYRRTGDAAKAEETWKQGAALFPQDTRFAEKLAGVQPGK